MKKTSIISLVIFIFLFIISCSNSNNLDNRKIINAHQGWNDLEFETNSFNTAAYVVGFIPPTNTNNSNNKTIEVNLVIPTFFNHIPIIGIRASAFDTNLMFETPKIITSVDFSHAHYLASISNNAFSNNAIEKLDFSSLDNLGSIEASAFSNNEITTIKFNSSLEFIGSQAFMNNNISNITLENNDELLYIGHNAFNLNNITSMTLKNLPSLRVLNLNHFNGVFRIYLTDLPNITAINGPLSLSINHIFILGTSVNENNDVNWWYQRLAVDLNFNFNNVTIDED